MTRQKRMMLRKKRLRTVVILLALSVSIAPISIGIAKLIGNDEVAAEITYVEYLVKDGDTLWSIAKKHSNNNVDLRDFIYEIEEKNQLESAVICRGDLLLIPMTYYGESE